MSRPILHRGLSGLIIARLAESPLAAGELAAALGVPVENIGSMLQSLKAQKQVGMKRGVGMPKWSIVTHGAKTGAKVGQRYTTPFAPLRFDAALCPLARQALCLLVAR